MLPRESEVESLRAGIRRLEEILQCAPDYIIRCDRAGLITYINRPAPNHDLSQMIGTSVERWMEPQHREAFRACLGRVFAGGRIDSYESRGSVTGRRYVTRISPVFEAGNVAAAVLVTHDVTDELRAQDALRESEERLRISFDLSPDAINLVRMEDGLWVAVNDGFTRITGWTAGEVIGKTGLELGLWVDMEARKRLYAELARTGHCEIENIPFCTRGGELVECSLASHVVQVGGKPHILSITRDLTASRSAERERDALQEGLRRAQKMEAVGRLAGGVAHDFNNMLTVIAGHTTLALKGEPPGTPRRESLEQVLAAAKRATDLTRQLLAFGSRQFLKPAKVDLNELCRDVTRLLRPAIGETIELLHLLTSGSTTVQVDRGHVEQAIVNLAVNARDAMPDGGVLTLETSRIEDGAAPGAPPGLGPGAWIALRVKDTGIGMDEETQRRAFEPFFTTKQGKGAGLGLASVYGIVKQCGGHISLSSRPGAGTTIEIFLPAVAGSAAASPGPADSAPVLGSARVLVVEDDDLVRRGVRSSLEQGGFRVFLAANCEEAEKILGGPEGVDLLLTDVVMPKTDGWTTAQRCRALRPGLRVLFMSGYTDNPLVRNGMAQDDLEFISKPFTPDELARKIAAVLAKPARGGGRG